MSKPIVIYVVGTLRTFVWRGELQANLFALNHPVFGASTIRTQGILEHHFDGVLETENIIYRPAEMPVGKMQ